MYYDEADFLFEEDKICTVGKPLLQENELSAQHDTMDSEEVEVEQSNATDPEILCVGQESSEKPSEDIYKQKTQLDRLGMTVTTNSVSITKDSNNLIGISIGGGAPMCPCLYIVQVFDGTPASHQGSLESGDELLAVNSVSVKGKTKMEVAKMIQNAPTEVTIHYNKLHIDTEQGKSLDIFLKKLKHRLVDSMPSSTADSLGLSRAILCNDTLVKRLEELEGTEIMYKGLVDHARRMLKAHYDLIQSYKSFGDVFTEISVREPQQRASETFRLFGEFHRNLEKDGIKILKKIKPILDDIGTYLNKAIPDTKYTVRRYADAKFTYLSYCLKIKEMDDEEHGYAALQEPLYRVETGNYEYRLILRCRQEARSKFAKLRTDVLEKMELLESKHVTDLNKQLRSLLECLAELNSSVVDRMEKLPHLFPIEVDFKETDFQYSSSTLKPQELDDEEENPHGFTESNVIYGKEAEEKPAEIVNVIVESKECLVAGLEDTLENAATPKNLSHSDNHELLKGLGLLDINLEVTSKETSHQQHISFPPPLAPYDFDLFLNQSAPKTTQSEQDLMSANSHEMDLILQ